MRFLILVGVLSLVFVAACTSSNSGGGSVVVRSGSIADCSGSTASCRASLAACQNLNSGLVADRNLKMLERNECLDRFNALADAVNAEREAKSEYGMVLDACYEQRLTYDSSGDWLFDLCPTCKDVLKCDSQSMMPAFNCKNSIRIERVRSESDVRVCDVIAFNQPSGNSLLHRVWKVYKDFDGVTRYKTAGDNSQQLDDYDPRFSDLIGEVAGVTTK